MKKWLILISLIAIFSGCGSNAVNSTNNFNIDEKTILKGDKSMSRVSYMVVKSSEYARDMFGYIQSKRENFIFHSDDPKEVALFNKMYQELTGQKAESFDGVMVIAKMGTFDTGGYSIKVSKIIDSGRYLEVYLNYISPDPKDIVTMALTSPYTIINIPNSHKDVKIIEE